MSKESVQFTEMVRQKYASLQPRRYDTTMECRNCGHYGKFHYLGDQGNNERYQCPECGLIRSVAVR